MKNIIFILGITFCTISHSKQVSSITDENGSIIKSKLKEYIEFVSPYIREYPPRFKSKDHQKKIQLSTMMVIGEIKALEIDTIKDIDLLIDFGYILSMGHNLDLGSSNLAKVYFDKAVSQEPDNVRANYLYGMFLVSTRKYFYDSIQYLEKALELGEEGARYTLGLIYMRKGNKEKSLKLLEEYAKNNPENNHVKKMIEHVKKDEVKVNTN